MNEEVQFCLDSAEENMAKSISHFESELLKISAGRANPHMLSNVKVDYYGTMTPLTQVANVGTPDARTLTVQPWEKAMLMELNKAIVNANIGFSPMDNGELLVINIIYYKNISIYFNVIIYLVSVYKKACACIYIHTHT